MIKFIFKLISCYWSFGPDWYLFAVYYCDAISIFKLLRICVVWFAIVSNENGKQFEINYLPLSGCKFDKCNQIVALENYAIRKHF